MHGTAPSNYFDLREQVRECFGFADDDEEWDIMHSGTILSERNMWLLSQTNFDPVRRAAAMVVAQRLTTLVGNSTQLESILRPFTRTVYHTHRNLF